MEKHLFILIIFFVFSSCSKEGGCFTSKGESTRQNFSLSEFHAIEIPMNVSVQIIPSDEHKMEIHSYENIISTIQYCISNDKLVITQSSDCSMLHSYQNALIKIYAKNIHTIESKTQFSVTSLDTITYPYLTLKTSFPTESASTHFDLIVDNESVYVEDNQVGFFKLSGKTKKLEAKLFGGNGVVNARDLVADAVAIYHRSNQNIHVKPIKVLDAIIGSVGNVYVYQIPDSVKVERLYSGDIIYK